MSTPGKREMAEKLSAEIGAMSVGVIARAEMHTPTSVTDEALSEVQNLGADCLLAIGGGLTIGLGKALAWRTGLPQVVLPTTYAGSEATPVLGQTEGAARPL
jgi:maleylacetate reductase